MISEQAQSSFATYTLPCGYLTADGKVLKSVTLHEMTGYEEDLMASSDLNSRESLEELVISCLDDLEGIKDKKEIREAVRNMTLADRTFLVMAVRRVTVSDVYRFQTVCPKCGHGQAKTVKLSELDTKGGDPTKQRAFEVTTPKGRVATLKMMTGADEEAAEKFQKEEPRKLATLALSLRVKKLDGVPTTVEMLQKLPSSERTFLRNAYNKVEPSVDTTLDATCEKKDCQFDFKVEINPGSKDFFFPSET
jgi:hypothetical protein